MLALIALGQAEFAEKLYKQRVLMDDLLIDLAADAKSNAPSYKETLKKKQTALAFW
jgi:hypothetical protein